jgi:hypothetical protein
MSKFKISFVICISSFFITFAYAQEKTIAPKINLLVITSKACTICDTAPMVDYLKKQFSDLDVSYLYYPNTKTIKMIKDFSIQGLPVYLLGKEAEKEKGFLDLKEKLQMKGDFYMLKPQFSGLSYFFDRERIKGRLDLFMSLYDKSAAQLLDVVREFNPNIHFLAIEQQDKFDAPAGNLEVEEDLRSVCAQKYYPKEFLDYIKCRAENINSSWWQDCLGGLDINKIMICSRGKEGTSLLKENISLNRQLEIMFGPTYLVDNQRIFSSKGAPSRKELMKIIKR